MYSSKSQYKGNPSSLNNLSTKQRMNTRTLDTSDWHTMNSHKTDDDHVVFQFRQILTDLNNFCAISAEREIPINTFQLAPRLYTQTAW